LEQFSTEEQQAEVLRKWLKENGPSILIGVGLGLAVMFGINRWQAHTMSNAEAASMQYAAFQMAAAQGDTKQLLAQAERLREDYADSAYAVFAALAAARDALSAAEPDAAAAERELRWVVDNADLSGLRQIGSIRLARLLLSNADTEGAEAVLAAARKGKDGKGKSSAFDALYAEIEGDVALANGDQPRAREAYTRALAGQGNAPMLRMKLENLGVNPES
jgi:predicted negative regulator of RcsB-dependent stress response